MDISSNWLFSNEELKGAPNRLSGLSEQQELKMRYKSALLIQELGDKLHLDQLSINTAIVYMHRFYTKQSFAKFSYKTMSPTCLMVSARILYQYQTVERVATMACNLICGENLPKELREERILDMMEDIIVDEDILLSTFGFDTTVDLPHSFILNACSSLTVSKEISRSSYLVASASLFSTMMCIKYPPTTVACACIMVARKWMGLENEAILNEEEWYKRIDQKLTFAKLKELSADLMAHINVFPTKFMKRMPVKTSEGQNELVNRPNVGSTPIAKTVQNANFQKKSAYSAMPISEHQNGSLPFKHSDNISAVHSGNAKKPVTISSNKTDDSNRSVHQPHKLLPTEVMTGASSVQSGFTALLPSDSKFKTEKRQTITVPLEQKIPKDEHQSYHAFSYSQPISSVSKSDDTHKQNGNASQIPPTLDSGKISSPMQPPHEKSIPSLNSELETEDCMKEKKRKKHKKEKSKHPEEKHKKSKHNREVQEDHRKVAPIRIKLPPVFPNLTQPLKTATEGSHESECVDKLNNTSFSESCKERLTVKISKDFHGNFYQQKQAEGISHLNESNRKRKHEQYCPSLKRPRQDNERASFSATFPPLPSAVEPPPFPSDVAAPPLQSISYPQS